MHQDRLAIGAKAKELRLPEPRTGRIIDLTELPAADASIVMFLCNHCPFVRHIHSGLIQLGRDYADRVNMVAVNSNDTDEYPDDGPEAMVRMARDYDFPFVFDETQAIARDFGARCTPDFLVFDRQLQLVYHGRFDESRPGSAIRVTGNDLRQAVDAVLAGNPVPVNDRPSVGCSIKWKAGNEPGS